MDCNCDICKLPMCRNLIANIRCDCVECLYYNIKPYDISNRCLKCYRIINDCNGQNPMISCYHITCHYKIALEIMHVYNYFLEKKYTKCDIYKFKVRLPKKFI